MTECSITKHLLSYAIPTILGNLLQLAYNAVDSIVVSKFMGKEALAAILCFIYVYQKQPLLRLKRNEFVVDKVLLKETLKSGSLTALQQAGQSPKNISNRPYD